MHDGTDGGEVLFMEAVFSLRRRIETDKDGRFHFRCIMPSGYACPPGGQTENLLQAMGRHNNRSGHAHFFVIAPGYRKLTTQIDIDGDKYLHDNFATHRSGLTKRWARAG